MDLMGYDIIVDHRFVSENSGATQIKSKKVFRIFWK